MTFKRATQVLYLWKFRLRCRHYPATRPRVVDPPFYRSGRRGIRVNPLSVESPRALSDKHACFGEWRKRGWGLLFLFLFSFSLFPIFLSGVGVRVSVLGLGFFHLSSFFDNKITTCLPLAFKKKKKGRFDRKSEFRTPLDSLLRRQQKQSQEPQ